MDIKIRAGARSVPLVIPWLPEEVKFSSGGVSFARYSLLDFGKVVIPNGVGLSVLSWESKFPGEKRRGTFYPEASTWKAPATYEKKLKQWKDKKTKLIVTVGASITLNCYLEDYDLTYSGGFGDVQYSVKFVEYRKISISVKRKVKKGAKTSTKRPAKTLKTYTIKSGDTLWKIASKYLGKGIRWREIYKLNKTVIEKAAKKHGRKSSNNGHWIYPKTKLKLPKK